MENVGDFVVCVEFEKGGGEILCGVSLVEFIGVENWCFICCLVGEEVFV